jgi:hypothetical protein
MFCFIVFSVGVGVGRGSSSIWTVGGRVRIFISPFIVTWRNIGRPMGGSGVLGFFGEGVDMREHFSLGLAGVITEMKFS